MELALLEPGAARAEEGECEGRNDGPGDEAPACVAIVVRGLKVTVLWALGGAERDVVSEAVRCVGRSGDASSTAVAMIDFSVVKVGQCY